jgi:hypothetical protein
MSAMKRYRVLIFALLVLTSGTLVVLQLGLLNWRQEFGTYGQYNRVLRVIHAMDGYKVIDSSLSRRLDWRNLGHVDRFSVRIRDADGRTRSVEFLHGSQEMKERDPKALEQIIKNKLRSPAVSR